MSVIIPMRNEERHIVPCLQSLIAQDYVREDYEIIVVDGQSSDRSVELVLKLGEDSRVQLYSNPLGVVPSSMNLGIRKATGEIIVRADAHTIYPQDYIRNCVRYLLETGATNVGGPVITVAAGQGLGAQLVAAILSNRFGVGGSRFRTSMYEGYVDTVPFGTFRKELFQQIGLFDESLVRNQDNELNARIRRSGGKIYQTPALCTKYFPASTFSKLLIQTYKNSQWHLFTLKQTGNSLGIRHLVPAMFVIALLVAALLSLKYSIALIMLWLMLAVYLSLAVVFSCQALSTVPTGVKVVLPFAFLIFHLTYGLGVLAGVKFLLRSPAARPISC